MESLLIGWKEFVDFPDWGLYRVRAKVDTGARTSAVDVASYELRKEAGGLVAVLRLALGRRSKEQLPVVEAPVLRMVVVTNSGGARETRPLVETTVKIGRRLERIQLTVTNRSPMRFRMLLGREALAGRFVVDVSKRYLLSRE